MVVSFLLKSNCTVVLKCLRVPLDYIEDLYKVMVEGIESDILIAATAELNSLARPPMNSMFDK